MSKMTDKPAVPRQTEMTHGVRAIADLGKLPSGRQYPPAMKEVSAARERLIAKYGGDKIELDVLAMVDSAAEIDTEKVARPAEGVVASSVRSQDKRAPEGESPKTGAQWVWAGQGGGGRS
ncbi:MAG: hypothetical protein MUQ00_14250 [Candidatus Aminicenantes bacterium]|nr:hypothetical protein [Candidatus Aminicenantes bacterium]